MILSDSTKKALTMLGGLALGIGLIFLVLNLIFQRPNNHQPTGTWEVVHIQMADGPDGFASRDLTRAQAVIPELNRLGPTFILGGEGQNVIRVVNVDLTNGHTGQCQDADGRFVTDLLTRQSHIEIDPTCTHGDLEFQAVLVHEVGHALGMGHVCRVEESGVRTDCSPVGHGVAAMNPSLVVDDGEEIGTDHVFHPPVPTWQIQGLDIQEFKRVQSLGRLTIH